jgi:hypothetical protein
MKKVFALLLCCMLVISLCPTGVFAFEPEDILVKRTVEWLENGDSITTEVYEYAIQPRSGKTGYASTIYNNSSGTTIWKVTVTGTFTYNGTSSSATSATATVNTYSTSASFVSKNAYTSGNTATATATVKYLHSQTTRSAKISCDKNGNLY